jgi:hypothetical protein
MLKVNVQGVREVPKERNVWILKDRCDKRREESVVRKFIICNVHYYFFIFIIILIKSRRDGQGM